MTSSTKETKSTVVFTCWSENNRRQLKGSQSSSNLWIRAHLWYVVNNISATICEYIYDHKSRERALPSFALTSIDNCSAISIRKYIISQLAYDFMSYSVGLIYLNDPMRQNYLLTSTKKIYFFPDSKFCDNSGFQGIVIRTLDF